MLSNSCPNRELEATCSCYLSILKDEEAYVLAVMDFVLLENRAGIVLDPHSS